MTKKLLSLERFKISQWNTTIDGDVIKPPNLRQGDNKVTDYLRNLCAKYLK